MRNQLLGLGFKPARHQSETVERRRSTNRPSVRPSPASQGKSKSPLAAQSGQRGSAASGPKPKPMPRQDGINLAKAYALRAEREKQERIEAELVKQANARQRRQAKARLGQLLQQKDLNAADADIARHFQYGGKIKRIYVTPAQLKALNAGDLGVVQHNGRFLLVESCVVAKVAQILPACVALDVNTQTTRASDGTSDPRFSVPDDLMW